MKKLINFRVPLLAGISLIFGIVFSYGVYFDKVLCSVFSATAFLLAVSLYVLFSFKGNKRIEGVIFCSVFLIFALFGGLSFTTTLNNYKKADLGNHLCDVTGRVVDVTDKEDYRVLILSNVRIGYPENVNTKYKISLVVPSESKLDYGDTISFTATIEDRSLIFNGRFNVYDVGNGVKYSATLLAGEYELISSDKNIFEKVRVFIRETLREGLDREEFSVVYALLTGNSDYIETQTLTNFRASGIAHIFAVSGLHIGFLSALLSFVFNKLKVNKWLKTFLIIASLFFYSGVCGFSASSLRATIMCSVMLFATNFGERYDGLSALGTALTLLLLAFPIQLFFVGFQLSFAVVFAILALSLPTTKLLKFLPKKLAVSLATVLVAQVASVPIMLYHFGEFSLISVIANLIFLPAVSVVFIFSLCSVLLAGILGAFEVLFPLNFVVKAIIWFINLLDYTVFMAGGITIGVSVVFYYLSFIVASGLINLKKTVKRITAIILICTFFLSMGAENLVEFNKCKIYSVSDNYSCATVVSVKNENFLILPYVKRGANLSCIDKIFLNRSKNVTALFILSRVDNLDVQQICTLLTGKVKVESVCVFGEENEKLNAVINKSFPEIELQYRSNFSIDKGRGRLSYLLNGKAVEITYGKSRALILGDYGVEDDLELLKGYTADYAVVYEMEEYLFSLINAKTKATYRYSKEYNNVQTSGLLLFNLKLN